MCTAMILWLSRGILSRGIARGTLRRPLEAGWIRCFSMGDKSPPSHSSTRGSEWAIARSEGEWRLRWDGWMGSKQRPILTHRKLQKTPCYKCHQSRECRGMLAHIGPWKQNLTTH